MHGSICLINTPALSNIYQYMYSTHLKNAFYEKIGTLQALLLTDSSKVVYMDSTMKWVRT